MLKISRRHALKSNRKIPQDPKYSHGGTRWSTLHPEKREPGLRKDLDARARAMPEPMIRPGEWWRTAAVILSMKSIPCPKCKAPETRASYSPPRDTLGECGIIRSCQLCGWEQVHLAGRHGRPYA